jgi:protease-4
VKAMKSAERRCGMLAGVAFVAVAAAVAVTGCGPTAFRVEPVPVDRSLKEEVLYDEGGWAPPKVAIVDVAGVLINANEPQLFGEGEHPVAMLTEKLDAARRDPAVKAVVLRINSPGGAVTAADIMYQELMRFRTEEKSGKPIVAMILDVGASGGYYIACACDKIYAERTSVVGSIGVIMQAVSFAGTMNKVGIEAVAIKSGTMKDAGSPFRDMTEEEVAVFQGLIDSLYAQFVDVVAAGRASLDAARVREISDGRVWSAQQALDLKLIDEIGTLRDAIGEAKKLAGIKRARVVLYRRPYAWKPNMYAAAPNGGVVNNYSALQVNMGGSMLTPPTPRFLYLWAPGL